MTFSRAALFFLPLMAGSSLAAADAIRPRPLDCQPGSYKRTNHCGSLCQPLPCNPDTSCTGGKQCRSTRLCIFKGMRSACGRASMIHRGKRFPYTKVTGDCSDKKKCPAGSSCVEAKRCVEARDKPQPPVKKQPGAKDTPQQPPVKKQPGAKDTSPARVEPGTPPRPPVKKEPAPAAPVKPKPAKPSSCSVSTPSLGVGSLLLLLLVGLRRRGNG